MIQRFVLFLLFLHVSRAFQLQHTKTAVKIQLVIFTHTHARARAHTHTHIPVSYTHLDVYKRQGHDQAGHN